jgi:putative oxidoreductase
MMARLLKPASEGFYTFLRILAGLMFCFHGVQKLFGVLTDHQPLVASQIWFGGIIELVTGAAIAVGVLTPWFAFLASGTMAVAYIQFHWQLHLDERFFPAVNQGELALLYSVLFLFIAGHGGGKLSVDQFLGRKHPSE